MHLLPENVVNLAAANIQQVHLADFHSPAPAFDVLRLDKIDPVISGNKWFKLKYYLEQALQGPPKKLLSFGGAWSNHIVATASAAKKTGLQSIGIIRGEQPATPSSMLLTAAELGMQLVFVDRETYNLKKNPAFTAALMQEYGQACVIPEGGAGEPGVRGSAEILQLVNLPEYTHLVCAVGTGTLLAGLAQGAVPGQQVMGIPVLRGFNNWQPAQTSTRKTENIVILSDYHHGGYAKKTGALLNFMNSWYRQTGMPTDFVYTGKLFFSIMDLIKKNYFPENAKILAIHSGGLQGNNSLPPGTLDF